MLRDYLKKWWRNFLFSSTWSTCTRASDNLVSDTPYTYILCRKFKFSHLDAKTLRLSRFKYMWEELAFLPYLTVGWLTDWWLIPMIRSKTSQSARVRSWQEFLVNRNTSILFNGAIFRFALGTYERSRRVEIITRLTSIAWITWISARLLEAVLRGAYFTRTRKFYNARLGKAGASATISYRRARVYTRSHRDVHLIFVRVRVKLHSILLVSAGAANGRNKWIYFVAFARAFPRRELKKNYRVISG